MFSISVGVHVFGLLGFVVFIVFVYLIGVWSGVWLVCVGLLSKGFGDEKWVGVSWVLVLLITRVIRLMGLLSGCRPACFFDVCAENGVLNPDFCLCSSYHVQEAAFETVLSDMVPGLFQEEP